MATLRGESLLAVVGVTVALRPGPVRVNQAVLARAEGLERGIRRRMRRFVREKAFQEPEKPPEFDFDEVVSLLPHAANEARNVENVSGYQDQGLADEFAEALGAAVGYIDAIVPRETLPALVGVKNMRPAGLDVADFRRRYLVIDRPPLVFDDMASGILTPDMVEAFREVYPSLYATSRAALFDAIVQATTTKSSYAKDQVLQVFLEEENLLSPDLQAELAKAFEDARERESGQKLDGSPSPRADKGIGDRATQQERLEAR